MDRIWYSFQEPENALLWAKENLPEEQYQKIQRSHKLLMKNTALFVFVCCIPIIIAFMYLIFAAPLSAGSETDAPIGATGNVLARVDYDGNFYWTHDSQKYEYALKEYGLSPEKYKFGDRVKVYVNDEQDVIGVTAVEDKTNLRIIEICVGIVGSIFVPVVLIMLIYMPIAHRTFGKPWIEFWRAFNISQGTGNTEGF